MQLRVKTVSIRQEMRRATLGNTRQATLGNMRRATLENTLAAVKTGNTRQVTSVNTRRGIQQATLENTLAAVKTGSMRQGSVLAAVETFPTVHVIVFYGVLEVRITLVVSVLLAAFPMVRPVDP
jgi:hypothetical protein